MQVHQSLQFLKIKGNSIFLSGTFERRGDSPLHRCLILPDLTA